MRTLVVQPASAGVLHCYVEGGSPFDYQMAAWLSRVQGVKSAHLVTAGRSPGRWCMVVEPEAPVEQGNAKRLRQLVSGISRRVGCANVRLERHLHRPTAEQGSASDVNDWLKH